VDMYGAASTLRPAGRATSRSIRCRTEGRKGGGQGGGEGGERRVVEVVRGPVGKRRSIMTTVPAHGGLSPRARIYFFVFVVHTMSTMAGAMQFSRG
jgi:hypothetical protein